MKRWHKKLMVDLGVKREREKIPLDEFATYITVLDMTGEATLHLKEKDKPIKVGTAILGDSIREIQISNKKQPGKYIMLYLGYEEPELEVVAFCPNCSKVVKAKRVELTVNNQLAFHLNCGHIVFYR